MIFAHFRFDFFWLFFFSFFKTLELPLKYFGSGQDPPKRGSKMGPKMVQKWPKNGHFWSIFGHFWSFLVIFGDTDMGGIGSIIEKWPKNDDFLVIFRVFSSFLITFFHFWRDPIGFCQKWSKSRKLHIFPPVTGFWGSPKWTHFGTPFWRGLGRYRNI